MAIERVPEHNAPSPKKASLWTSFLILLLLINHPLAASDCDAPINTETVHIKWVVDGDTVHLTDGRKVRLLGLNTPEIARKRKLAEPLAESARLRLLQLISPYQTIRLQQGHENKDRYQRTLANLYLPDGTNLSQILLREGLASLLIMPPNLRHSECFISAQTYAKTRRAGVWALDKYQASAVDTLEPDSNKGFIVIQGKIMRIGESRDSIWLNFNHKVSLRIFKRDLDYFHTFPINKLLGKAIEVQGWFHPYKDRLRMRIYHPSQIRILKSVSAGS